jgi:hypothetical protein
MISRAAAPDGDEEESDGADPSNLDAAARQREDERDAADAVQTLCTLGFAWQELSADAQAAVEQLLVRTHERRRALQQSALAGAAGLEGQAGQRRAEQDTVRLLRRVSGAVAAMRARSVSFQSL